MTIHDSPPPAPADPSEQLLKSLGQRLDPDAGAQARVQRRIRSSIDPIRHLTLWERLRASLTPSNDVRDVLWNRFSLRLQPVYARPAFARPVKWVAAFAVVLVAVRLSPLLFLAPQTIADSPVTLTAGPSGVEVLIGSLWQQVSGEVTLHSPTRMQTQNGEATIVDHDDAVFRLAPHTQLSLLDLSDRPENSSQDSTLTLENGQLWTLGLVPTQVRGLTIVTAQGRVLVHEGSVSVKVDGENVTVSVFDRSAAVLRHGKQITLVAGEQVTLTKDSDLVARKMDPSAFQESWFSLNLSRDAAHQREIAQLQLERRAAAAGIPRDSTLYPLKRLAENVEVLLAFNADDRAQALITQANTRLNEAAALIGNAGDAQAQSQASDALQEYKQTMLAVASGSGGSPTVQSMLQKEVVEGGAATVSAALPGDPSYPLKQAVDATIAELPVNVPKPDMEGEALLDQLSAVKHQADQGDTQLAKDHLSQLSDSLDALNTTGALSLVSPDVRQEAKAVVQQVTDTVDETQKSDVLPLGAPKKEFVMPMHPMRAVPGWYNSSATPLTPEEIAAKAQEIRGRIFLFDTKKAQYSTLEDQLALISHHPDRGSILRELAKVLPMNGLAQRVMREMRVVNEQIQQQLTESGSQGASSSVQ